jgi:hypothetical protein
MHREGRLHFYGIEPILGELNSDALLSFKRVFVENNCIETSFGFDVM